MKYLILDCDGVLTDGKKHIGANGERQFISFHSRDNEGIKMFCSIGFYVVIVSASNFVGIRKYWDKRGPSVFTGVKDKKELLSEIVDWSNSICVGDDLIDFEMLNRAQLSFVPSDAHPSLVKYFDTLETPGGAGIVSELWEIYSNMIDNGIFSGEGLKINTHKPYICGEVRGYYKGGTKNGN